MMRIQDKVTTALAMLFLMLLQVETATAQAITVTPSQLNFGTVYENAPDSLPITLTNTLNRSVTVYGFRYYPIYGQPAFSNRYTWMVIPAAGSVTVWVKFTPRHNVFHNSELIIMDDGLRGVNRVDLIGQGRYSNAYYDSTENKSEEILKTAFHTLLAQNYDTLGYLAGRDSMFMWFDNRARNGQGAAQNTIESVYTGALAVGYIDRTDCQNTFSFNTEHTFPQSFFSSLEPMKSDLHHLYPTDDLSNNQRGNNPFAVITSNIIWSDGGSKSNGTSFEPRDLQKGRASRSLLYFVLRYQDYANFVQPQEPLLRQWHAGFPPDAVERKRNSDIFSIQNNRNPFVDYPQFIERIHSVTSLSVEPLTPSLDFPEDTIVFGYVNTGNSATFEYVVVNTGNQLIDLTNFALTQPGVFSFSAGGGNVNLAPGEAAVLRITATPSGSGAVLGHLTFNTTLASMAAVDVPIYLNDPVINTIPSVEASPFDFFPNPVSSELNIRNPFSTSFQLQVFDITGHVVLQQEIASGTTSVDVSSLASGCYSARLTTPGLRFHRTFIKP